MQNGMIRYVSLLVVSCSENKYKQKKKSISNKFTQLRHHLCKPIIDGTIKQTGENETIQVPVAILIRQERHMLKKQLFEERQLKQKIHNDQEQWCLYLVIQRI